MPRSTTMQARAMPKRSRSRVTTGTSIVTSAVWPGTRNDAIDRSASSSTACVLRYHHPLVRRDLDREPGSARPLQRLSWPPQTDRARHRCGGEQRQTMAVERLFESLVGAAAGLVRFTEPGHGLVGMMEVALLGARDAHAIAPIVSVAIRARDHQPVSTVRQTARSMSQPKRRSVSRPVNTSRHPVSAHSRPKTRSGPILVRRSSDNSRR
jgi:hypothetical protein